MFRTHRRVLEIVKAVVCEDEPPSLPGFHSAPWQEEQTGSHTMATVTDWLPTSRKKRTGGEGTLLCGLLHPRLHVYTWLDSANPAIQV